MKNTCLSYLLNNKHTWWYPDNENYQGGSFNLTIPSYQFRDSHCKDKMVWQLSHLNNGNPDTRKDILYWDETHSISRKGIEIVFCSFSCLCSITFHKVHYRGYLLLSLTKGGIDQRDTVVIQNQHNKGNYQIDVAMNLKFEYGVNIVMGRRLRSQLAFLIWIWNDLPYTH